MRSRALLFAMLAVAFGLAASAGVIEVLLRFLPVYSGLQPSAVNAEHPILHFLPDRAFTYSRAWNLRGVNYGQINNFGFVNDQDYEQDAAGPLIAVIGDSYVEAVMVPYPSTFHGRLAAAVRGGGRVYSFGVSGAPLSQYLACATWVNQVFHPDVIIISVVANDFDESLLRYKNSPGFHYFDDSTDDWRLERLDYEPNKMPLRRSALYRYVRHNLKAVDSVLKLVSPPNTMQYIGNVTVTVAPERLSRSKRVVDSVVAELPLVTGLQSKNIIFVVDGIRPGLYSAAGLAEAGGSYWDVMRQYFIRKASAHGYEVIDLQPLFMEQHRRTDQHFEYEDDGHWNEAGHQLVASAIIDARAFQQLFGR